MAELTGLDGVDWATVYFILFGFALAAMSARRDVDGSRVGSLLVIPMLSGVLLVATIGIRSADDIHRLLPFLLRPVTAALAVGALLVSAAVADLLFTRFVRLPYLLWRKAPPPWLGDASLALFVAGAAFASGVTMIRLSPTTHTGQNVSGLGANFSIEAVYPLPSPPLDVELRSDGEGYVSLGTRVARFEIPRQPGSPIRLTTVADGFTYTRGLTIVDDVLVVGDLGPLPCPEPIPVCKGRDVPDVDVIEGERRILKGSQGRLVAYDVEPDGTLTNERVILDNLPVANSEHGVNGIETGPDGRIYVAIGNLDRLPEALARTVDHPRQDLLGTVIRLSPDGRNQAVFASGLRNVYGLAFDDRGELWGVDNDGEHPMGGGLRRSSTSDTGATTAILARGASASSRSETTSPSGMPEGMGLPGSCGQTS